MSDEENRMSASVDCLLVGHHETDFAEYVGWVRGMGRESGACRDLELAVVDLDGRPRHALDVLNALSPLTAGRTLTNTDFLWPTIPYLGTYLSRRGFTFDYINRLAEEKDAFADRLRDGSIRSVAISTTLYVSALPVLAIVGWVRSCNPRVPIIVGGPYVANQFEYQDREALPDQLRYLGADVYVNSSEGEATLVKILAALRDGGDLSGIGNLAYRDGDAIRFTPAEPEANALEENMVDYGLFPRDRIGAFVSTRTAKSCPFTCSFCGFPQRAGRYKYLSPELVERELDALAALGGVTTVTFLDDTFNVPKKRFQEILRMMIRKAYGFRWNAFYRSDHGDEETIALMGEAGCEGVFLGVESGSDVTLKRMNKTARRADYLRSIPLLRQAGIISHASVIIGYPGETWESAMETVSLIEEARPDYFRAQLWYADPLTPIWEKRDEYGVKGSAFQWTHDTMTSAEACDFVDRMFTSVRGSTWLPQQGFELWSLFYLERLGATREGVKQYVRAFNLAIKERLLDPARREASPAARDLLVRAARFARGDEAALGRELEAREEAVRLRAGGFAGFVRQPGGATAEELALLDD